MVIQRRLRITIHSALNRDFKDWGKIFHDMVCAKGIIDRLVHHSDVIRIEGTSYRLKDRKTQSLAESE